MDTYSQEQRHFLWLSESLGSASQALDRVLALFGSPEPVWEEPESFSPFMQPAQYKRLMDNHSEAWIDDRLDQVESCGARVIFSGDPDYPVLLARIPDPPSLLYVRGSLPADMTRAVGIVGTRRPSRDGVKTARELAHDVSDAGVTVVSGLARGIDAAAHEGAMLGRTGTLAVLGFGVDIRQPAENAGMFDLIVSKGGALVSEYPPGTAPFAGNFVRRNRIISGLSQGTVLVEGAEDSGAMITLKDAQKQGRVRFAVPGSIYQINSTAPNALLKDGALCVTCASDILSRFGWDRAGGAADAPGKKPRPTLAGLQGKIYDLLEIEDMGFSELAEAAGQDAATLSAELTMMEIEGYITALPGNVYRIAT